MHPRSRRYALARRNVGNALYCSSAIFPGVSKNYSLFLRQYGSKAQVISCKVKQYVHSRMYLNIHELT